MPQWMQDLTTGWPMIRANLPTFVVIVVLITGAVWAALSWSYGSIISHQASEIKLLERQKAEGVALPKPSPLEVAAPQVTDVQRLIKDPRLDWDAGGRLSLQGRYSRPGGPISAYVTYVAGPTLLLPRKKNTVLSIGSGVEPRIKVDSLAHFDGDEVADITLGFVIEDNGFILRWGQPQQNKTSIGITFSSYFCTMILVWNDGKSEDSYPFEIIAAHLKPDLPAGQQPPPVMIGPDVLFAHRKLEVK
jgi:hypothetical protein